MLICIGSLRLTFAGLIERDRLVIAGCAERGIPVIVTLGGGYARRVSDTARIHQIRFHQPTLICARLSPEAFPRKSI